jgi:hypothetical protein
MLRRRQIARLQKDQPPHRCLCRTQKPKNHQPNALLNNTNRPTLFDPHRSKHLRHKRQERRAVQVYDALEIHVWAGLR